MSSESTEAAMEIESKSVPNVDTNRSKWAINWQLFWPKAIYFWYSLAMSNCIPFIPLYLADAGLSSMDIGLIYSVKPFVGFFAMSFWAWVADRVGKHQAIIVMLLTSATALRLSLLLCSSPFALAAVVIGAEFLGSSVDPIIDSTVLDALPDPSLYGEQRLWGAIGWGWVGAPLAGAVIAAYGVPAAVCLHGAFVAAALLILALRLRARAPPYTGGGALRAARSLCAAPADAAFVAAAAAMGLAEGAVRSFSMLLLRQLGDGGLVMGAALAVTCLAEVPVFARADALAARLGGPAPAAAACLACMAARLAAYGAAPAAWAVLPTELLHGVTFALLFAVGTAHCRRLAPEGLGATAQALFCGVRFGFGCGLGSLIAGWLSNRYGLQNMYLIFAAGTGACAVVLYVVHALGWLGVSAAAAAAAGGAEARGYGKFDADDGPGVSESAPRQPELAAGAVGPPPPRVAGAAAAEAS